MSRLRIICYTAIIMEILPFLAHFISAPHMEPNIVSYYFYY